MSRGVWLVVAMQLLPFIFFSGGGNPGPARIVVVSLVLAAVLFLVAGVSQAFAQSGEAIDMRGAIRAARSVYGQFLWLIIKAGLLAIALVNLAMYAALTIYAMEPAAVVGQVIGAYPLAAPVLGFAFVYWLPIVFVERNFLLFATLQAAIATAWRRLRCSAYLAILTLTPAIGALFFSDDAPIAVMVSFNVVATLMSWIAYVYCVEWLQRARAVATVENPSVP